MEIYTLPLYHYPNYSYRTLIDGKSYYLYFSWNNEGQFWSVSFFDFQNQPIVLGVKLVQDYNLISNYWYNEKMPKVRFELASLESNNNEPSQFNVIDKFSLQYMTYMATDEQIP